MFWLAFGASLFVLTYILSRARQVRPLFADQHLSEVAALLPDLKRQALAGGVDHPASGSTAALTVGYTITHAETTWEHHLSVSSPVTPARAAGTFFLGLVRGALGIDGPPAAVFVSNHQVFHLIVRLSEAEHAAFVARPVVSPAPVELRGLAIDGRRVLLPQVVERAAPALPAKPT